MCNACAVPALRGTAEIAICAEGVKYGISGLPLTPSTGGTALQYPDAGYEEAAARCSLVKSRGVEISATMPAGASGSAHDQWPRSTCSGHGQDLRSAARLLICYFCFYWAGSVDAQIPPSGCPDGFKEEKGICIKPLPEAPPPPPITTLLEAAEFGDLGLVRAAWLYFACRPASGD